MSSIHEKMNQDAIWLRNKPFDGNGQHKDFGWTIRYDYALNGKERIEMTYRTIGKQYDWEMEKFRSSSKPPNYANRFRVTKNVIRFIKNPFAYLAWKNAATFRGFRPTTYNRFYVAMLGLTMLMTLQQQEMSNNIDMVLGHYGKTIEGRSGSLAGFQKQQRPRYIYDPDRFASMTPTPDTIIMNPTWKQNIRKELQLTTIYQVDF